MIKNHKKFTIRHQREASFFDEEAETFLELTEKDQGKSLLINKDVVLRNYPAYYQYAYGLLGDISEKSILDMGCGTGKSSVLLALKGAYINAFDVSQKSVEVTKLRAKVNRVEDRIKVEQIVAEEMKYDSKSFDCVFGVGILHHIDIAVAAEEIAKVLKNKGQAIFIEPIAFSALLRKTRKLPLVKMIVPNKGKNVLITEDERQLYLSDLEFFRKNFRTVDYKPFQLFSRLDRLIGGYPVTRGQKIISLINRFDQILLDKFFFLSRFGRWGVIRLVK